MRVIQHRTGVLVIGGGLAGLCAALRAGEEGARVILAAKGRAGRSGNTIMARNSLAAVMKQEEPDEPLSKATAGERRRDEAPVELVNLHIEDTMAGGAYINDRELVTVLARQAREAILWLAKRGVPFRREKDAFILKGSPGHSRERMLTADWSGLGQSRTAGMAMTLPLLERVRAAGVEIMDNLLIAGLLKYDGRVVGAYGFQRETPRLVLIGCDAVILACGGAGRLYPATTNTADVTGDGTALAHLAGAMLRDMEFIQFLPTMALKPPRLAISNSPFSAGAVLRNREGEDFMHRYSPDGCMATRDIMARAIFAEAGAGRGTDRGGVYMDFSDIPPCVMARKYPDIQEYLRGRTRVEVGPAAHFTMGGVVIDSHCSTTVPGLYACGETAGGVHGANRLAGNALTEAAVFGLRAGEWAAGESEGVKGFGQFRGSGEAGGLRRVTGGVFTGEQVEKITRQARADFASGDVVDHGTAAETVDWDALVRELRELMGRYVGLVRCTKGLHEARSGLAQLQRRLENANLVNYRALLQYHQTRLMLTTAKLITDAALARTESVGAHHRA